MKIDVEGGELGVLEGAKRLLKDIRPVFYIEVGSAQSLAVTERFVSNDYLLFGDSGAEQLIDKCVFNTLAVPRELHQKG